MSLNEGHTPDRGATVMVEDGPYARAIARLDNLYRQREQEPPRLTAQTTLKRRRVAFIESLLRDRDDWITRQELLEALRQEFGDVSGCTIKRDLSDLVSEGRIHWSRHDRPMRVGHPGLDPEGTLTLLQQAVLAELRAAPPVGIRCGAIAAKIGRSSQAVGNVLQALSRRGLAINPGKATYAPKWRAKEVARD